MLGPGDVPGLRSLVATTKQKQQRGAALGEIDPVARAEIDPKLADAFANRLDIAGISSGKPIILTRILALPR
jgi:hypothetical protein